MLAFARSGNLCWAGHSWRVLLLHLARTIGISQHADQDGPECPILLAVDEELGEDAGLGSG
jgi:hypothetical protein